GSSAGSQGSRHGRWSRRLARWPRPSSTPDGCARCSVSDPSKTPARASAQDEPCPILPERTMTFLTLLLLATAPECPALVPGSLEFAQLGWLAGSWSGEEHGTVSEEVWLAPRGGLMLGMHRDTGGGKNTGF